MSAELGHAVSDQGQGAWTTLATAVAGLAHLETLPPVPCQDVAGAVGGRRPTLVVADGAGSSPASELGARAMVRAMLRLVDTLEGQVARLLDDTDEPAEPVLRQFALLLVKHAKGVLQDQASEQHRPVRDLRCTLSLVVLGRSRLLWLKVGDGAIVMEQAVPAESPDPEAAERFLQLTTLGEPGKGEFANQTVFVDDCLTPDQVQSGSHDIAAVTGAAVMSDGAAEKLVANDGGRVAGQLSHWLDDLRDGRLRQRHLVRFFYSEAFCRGTAGDDRSIALASRELVP
jgi:hypothetical protein